MEVAAGDAETAHGDDSDELLNDNEEKLEAVRTEQSSPPSFECARWRPQVTAAARIPRPRRPAPVATRRKRGWQLRLAGVKKTARSNSVWGADAA